MHTTTYTHLLKRIKKLRSLYLPLKFDLTGRYDDKTYELVSAFKILVHAEFEYYFEEIALAIATKAYKKWTVTSRATKPILAIIAYHGGGSSTIPDTVTDNNRINQDLDYRIQKAYESYNKQIRSNNHGIKSKNLFNIFLPIGILITDFDEAMLIALDNFSKERGAIAHLTRAKTLVSPEDALNEITNIMSYVNTFDELLCSYKNSIR